MKRSYEYLFRLLFSAGCSATEADKIASELASC